MRLAIVVPAALVACLALLPGCFLSDEAESFVEKFFDSVYKEKKPDPLLARMTETMALEVQDRRLGIYDAKEKFSEKYRGYELLQVKTRSTDERKAIYGLVQEIPREGEKTYRTFVAKFLKRTAADGNAQWILYDLVIEKGKKNEQAALLAAVLEASPRTRAILRALPNKVSVFIFDRGANTLSAHLVKELASWNEEKIALQYINPEVERATAESYGITKPGSIVIERGKARCRLKTPDLFFLKDIGPEKTEGWYEGERMFAGAFARVGGDDQALLYVTGHGERDPKAIGFPGASQLVTELDRSGFVVTVGAVDEKTLTNKPVVLINDPRSDLTMKETELLTKHLEGGGRLLLMLEKNPPGSVQRLVAGLGLNTYNLTPVDPYNKESFRGPAWIECQLNPNPVTVNYVDRSKFRVLLAESVCFYVDKAKTNGPWIPHSIVSTSSNGWAESDYDKEKPDEVQFTAGADIGGPVPLAYAVKQRGKADKDAGRVILFGDADFVSNMLLEPRISNWLFFRETLNWLWNPEFFQIEPKRCNPKMMMGIEN